MHEKLFYEYAILRVVPRPEREEFINAGVILYCKQKRSVLCLHHLNAQKILSVYPEADAGLLRKNIDAFSLVCRGEKTAASPIAQLDAASRFRWLTAKRSTMLQCSAVHSGWCYDLDLQLRKIFNEQVS